LFYTQSQDRLLAYKVKASSAYSAFCICPVIMAIQFTLKILSRRRIRL